MKVKLPMPKPRKLQWARRLVQLSVLGFIVAVPILGRYGNYLASRELDAMHDSWSGTAAGASLEAVDGVLRALPGGERERAGRTIRDDEKALERIQTVRGNVWSAEIAGVSFTDPLAAAESFAASRHAVNVLIIGLLIPLVVTLLLGRVFCGWLCPMNLFLEMTDKLRKALRFLELPAFNVRFPRATKYVTLAAGLFLAYFWSLPVLGSFYPPAVIGREARGAVNAFYDRAEEGLDWWWHGLSTATLLILGIALFEVLVSRRWWCRYVCPGGALYSLLGRFRVVRVERSAERCTACGECIRVCPMGLAPMKDVLGMECDSCGLCISHCDDDALHYRFTVRERKHAESEPEMTREPATGRGSEVAREPEVASVARGVSKVEGA